MKSKILIVNKFYYPRGGDCVYTLNIERLLSEQGHETAIFAMNYPDNIESQWSRYFASEVAFSGGPASLLKGVQRTLGLGDIKHQFNRLLKDFKPDVVHLNNIHSYLSPVLAQLAKKAGARVVWTLHDYKLVCPAYSCLNAGKPCEACIDGNKWNVVKNRCMKGSLAASAVAWLEALRWNRDTLQRCVDTFICPSEFMRSKMLQGGFDPNKLVTLCNFVDPVKLEHLSNMSSTKHLHDTYCFIGRLSTEKGVDRLLPVAAKLPYTLILAGTGPLEQELKAKYATCPNIKFVGHLNATEVVQLLASSHASIIPSCVYENNPLSVIESLCIGTPVIGARIGGIPDLIDNNGATYQWDNPDSQAQAICHVMNQEWDNATISHRACQRFSPIAFYNELTKIYSEV